MEIDLFSAVRLLWARRYFILGIGLSALALALGGSYFMAPVYRANIEFLMQASGGKQSPAAAFGLSSLAGQFGLDMGGNQKIFDIFPHVLESRTFLLDLKSLRLDVGKDSGKTLPEYLLPAPDPKVPFDILWVDKMRSIITLTKDKDGVNLLSVKGTDPEFTAFLANTLVSRLEKYYSALDTKKASQNLEFLEAKHEAAQTELSALAEELRLFKERNREVNTPFLMQKLYWIQMQQKIKEEKYLLLTREYEAAKIDFEKVRPIVVIVDKAIVPFSKSEPRRKVIAILAFAVGTLFSILWIFGREWLHRARKS